MSRLRQESLYVALALLAWGTGALARPASAAPATAPAPAARPAPKPAAKPARLSTSAPHRPLTLAAQTIEGRSEAPRVLFVHTGPTLALEDAPKHPSYLRDDFTAALSSPVTVRVRRIEPLRATPTPGGSR